MQRLFSMFPARRPGFALLLMRLALAIVQVDGWWDRAQEPLATWWLVASASLAFALCIGVLLPIACVGSVVLEATRWIAAEARIDTLHVCAVMDAVALLMLGPGAYSLDAKLFGRRRVIVHSRRDHETE